jgi:hypothetical protein
MPNFLNKILFLCFASLTSLLNDNTSIQVFNPGLKQKNLEGLVLDSRKN